MKQTQPWSGSLFPVLVLLVLALLTFGLERAVRPDKKAVRVGQDKTPDSIVDNVVIWHFNSSGVIEHRIDGSRLLGYRGRDNSELQQPTVTYYEGVDNPSLNLRSDTSFLRKGKTEVYLSGHVKLLRPAAEGIPEMTMTTKEMLVYPAEKRALTTSKVDLKRGVSWIKGEGMEIDQNKGTLQLKSKVSGVIYTTPQP